MISYLSSTGYSNTVVSSQQISSNSSSEAASFVENKIVNDTVTISREGKSASLLSRINSLKEFPSTVEEINQLLMEDTASVENKIRGIYTKLGISNDTDLKISVDRNGKILVRGDSQKAEEAAEAINNDPELSNTIRRMSANTSLLDAIKKHLEFAKAYEEDPEAAIEEFAFLLDDNRQSSVTFTMSKGGISSETSHV